MKFQNGNQMFAGLSDAAHNQYPAIEVVPLKDHGKAAAKEVIYVDDSLDASQVVSEVTQKRLQNLLQKNEGRFEQCLLASGKLIESREEYFKSHYCYIDEKPKKDLFIPFEGTFGKEEMKVKALEFFESLGCTMSLIQAADAVVEELYMNAVMDAPREAAKKGYTLERKNFEFYICQTDSSLQISCTDPYGSLDIHKCLGRMNEVYTQGVGEAIRFDRPGSGAGIGCVILFEQCSSLILGVQPGVRTKVTCLIPLGVGNRHRTEMKKSLQWFEI